MLRSFLLRPRSLSRRRTTSALFFVCSVIVITTENHKCSVHCLLRDRCHDGEPRVLCSLFAARSLSRRRTTSAPFVICSDRDRCHDREPRVLRSIFAPTEIVVRTENHKCSVHCLLRDRCHDGEPRVLCSLLSPRPFSRRRTTSALLIACSEIVVRTENYECSVDCLL